jgi:excisionase family DNA binding protein
MANTPDPEHLTAFRVQRGRRPEPIGGDITRQTYTVAEAARIIGVSTRALHAQIQQNRFPHRRVGARVIIPKTILAEWLSDKHNPDTTEAADTP